MTREERRGFDNGLWLCGGCSPKIDGDFGSYPKEILQGWKADAEAKARRAQGMRPVANGLQDLLQQALAVQTQKSLPMSVSEALFSESRSLEVLDPRFKVTPSWQHGMTSFELVPTEPVKASWQLRANGKEHYKTGLRSMIEHGQSFEFDIADVSFQGSPLLEKIFSEQEGKVVLTPRRISASAQIVIRHQDRGFTELLVEIEGELVRGSKTATFSGSAFDDCFKLSIPITLEDAAAPGCLIALEASLASWEGRRLADLPQLARLLQLYQRLASTAELYLIIAIEGQECWEVSFGSPLTAQHARQTYNFLRLAAAARQLSIAFNPSILWRFDKLHEMSPASDILEVQAILNGLTLESTIPPESLEFTTPDYQSVRSMRRMNTDEAIDFTFVESKGKVILLLGVPIQLPKLQVDFDCAFVSLGAARKVGTAEYQGEIRVRAGEHFSMRRQFID